MMCGIEFFSLTAPLPHPDNARAPRMMLLSPHQPAMNNNNKLKVFSGRANLALAEKIAEELGDALGKVTLSNFPDGEISVRIEEDVRSPRVPGAADLSAGQRQSHGVVDHGGQLQACRSLGAASLRFCPIMATLARIAN